MKRKAQSILEYTLIFAVVVAAIVLAGKAMVKPAVNQGFTDATDAMKSATGNFKTSFSE
ncbi:MAG: hypothetical protein K9L61_00640 [Candidatus Omnitrophica bacterium]|nr:hypothetical protein [Candidatus Omnitrophota bacterium]